MPDFNVIENVSQTLVAIIAEGIKIVDPSQGATGVQSNELAVLTDLHDPPAIPSTFPGVVAVTLVEVREDTHSRNRPDRLSTTSRVPNSLVRQKPPMALKLRYLVTPWSDKQNQEGRKYEQRMLGRILQIFYDTPILSGSVLKGQGDLHGQGPLTSRGEGLANSSEVLKVTLSKLTFEEQTRFWHAIQQRYRPSLTYDVRVVNLEPTLETSESIVVDRTLEFGGVGQS